MSAPRLLASQAARSVLRRYPNDISKARRALSTSDDGMGDGASSRGSSSRNGRNMSRAVSSRGGGSSSSSSSCSNPLHHDVRPTSSPRHHRGFSSTAITSAEAEATSSSSSPPPPAAPTPAVEPKLSAIVDSIEKLTLLEASELVKALKTRLNISEIAMPAASAAPVAGAGGAGGAAGAGEAEADEAASKPKEKTIFTLKLKGLKDAGAKAKVIREVKAINSTMNLVEAKKFVESAPQTLKEGLTKDEAEKLRKAIEEAGGVVELE